MLILGVVITLHTLLPFLLYSNSLLFSKLLMVKKKISYKYIIAKSTKQIKYKYGTKKNYSLCLSMKDTV